MKDFFDPIFNFFKQQPILYPIILLATIFCYLSGINDEKCFTQFHFHPECLLINIKDKSILFLSTAILITSLGITRFLIMINFIDLLARLPILSDIFYAIDYKSREIIWRWIEMRDYFADSRNIGVANKLMDNPDRFIIEMRYYLIHYPIKSLDDLLLHYPEYNDVDTEFMYKIFTTLQKSHIIYQNPQGHYTMPYCVIRYCDKLEQKLELQKRIEFEQLSLWRIIVNTLAILKPKELLSECKKLRDIIWNKITQFTFSSLILKITQSELLILALSFAASYTLYHLAITILFLPNICAVPFFIIALPILYHSIISATKITTLPYFWATTIVSTELGILSLLHIPSISPYLSVS